jgi:UDP-N-acetylmuramoyl-L-alanyl-D-glutamate--2,6-diaminopimelate ligase
MLKYIVYYLKRPYHFFKTGLLQGLLAQLKYRFPANKIKVITITGTDGKTTTSTLVFDMLNQAGHKAGLISTVEAKIGQEKIDTGLHVTAPRPLQLQKLLRKMVDADCEYAVIEMTSHGVYQYRDWGIKPLIAGLTNVSHEHLDYHLNYNQYIQAKSLLLRKAQVVFLNEDDQSFYKMRQRLDLRQQKINSYSAQEKLDSKIQQAIKLKFPEPYNQMNARLAIKIAQHLQLKKTDIVQAIKNFQGVAGRMEEIKAGQPFRVFVDFAHTPNALDKALGSLRKKFNQQKTTGRLITLFGSAGHRDQSKRPFMGKAAVKHADLVIITADDPRTENIWTIIQQIKSGAKGSLHKIISIADRRQALEFALTKLAKPGDIVGLMGKGPEKSLAIGHQEIPWSDKKIATEILQNKFKKS